MKCVEDKWKQTKVCFKSLLIVSDPQSHAFTLFITPIKTVVFLSTDVIGVLLKPADNTRPPWMARSPMSISKSAS